MRSVDMAEEMAHRENDRYGNAPLRRAPDPDRIARHLATGEQPVTEESLIASKNPDGFTTESPIRAFTEFKVDGLYAIGKGFRPSLAHLTAYMSAMETKEGWQFIQVILPRDNDGEPTMMFRKVVPPMHVIDFGKGFETVEAARRVEENIYDSVSRLMLNPDIAGERIIGKPVIDASKMISYIANFLNIDEKQLMSEFVRTAKSSRKLFTAEHSALRPIERLASCAMLRDKASSAISAAYDGYLKTVSPYEEKAANLRYAMPYSKPVYDDPIHPKHYDGNACAEIIDHMPTNVGLAAKYIWRLGDKDPIAQEIGKLIFYLKRQILLVDGKHAGFGRALFGFDNPTRAGKYQDYAAKRISERFHGLLYETQRAQAMTNLVYFTTNGNTSLLHGAISDMESILACE